MAESNLAEVLKEIGAVLIRKKKHLVYQLPNGRRVAVSNSPSDKHAANQAIRQLRRVAAGGQQ